MSNNDDCVWVYCRGFDVEHYFTTEEEANEWWQSYIKEVDGDVEGEIVRIWKYVPK